MCDIGGTGGGLNSNFPKTLGWEQIKLYLVAAHRDDSADEGFGFGG